MRLLHMVEPGAGGGPCLLRLLATLIQHQPTNQHDVLVLGTRDDADAARACGIEPVGNICLPRRLPFSVKRALARRLAPVERSGNPWVLIHSWSARAAILAGLAAPHRARVVSLPSGPSSVREARVLAALLRRLPAKVLASNEAARESWRAAGIPFRLISVAHPPFSAAADCEQDREAIRSTWRTQSPIDEGTVIIGVICDQPCDTSAIEAFEIVGRLALGGRNVRMVMHPNMRDRAVMERYARRLGLEDRIIQDGSVSRPWSIASGLDLSLGLQPIALPRGRWQANHADVNAHFIAATGVPLVAAETPALRSMFADQHDGVDAKVPVAQLFHPSRLNDATAMLAELCDNRDLRKRCGQSVAARIQKLHSLETFLETFGRACDEALDQRW